MSSAAGTSKVEIISEAFSLLGKPRPINDLNESPTTAAVSKLYDTWKLRLLSTYPWFFSRTTEQLVQLTSAPINTFWQYAYQMPSDLLVLRAVFVGGNGFKYTDFELQQDQIWSHWSDNLFCEYHANVSEDNFPAYFVTAITTMIASISCMQVTQDATLTEFWTKVAEEELMIAKNIDSQSRPNSFLQRNDIYAAHFSGFTGGW